MASPTARLITAAAGSADIEELAAALLQHVGDAPAAAGFWSRFGAGRWHLIRGHGDAPPTPPGSDAAGWTALSVRVGDRTTTMAVAPALDDPEEVAVLEAALTAGLEVLEARAAVDAATYGGDRRIATVLDAVPDAVLIVSSAGSVLQANARAVELFGYPLVELIGLTVRQLLPQGLPEASDDEADPGRVGSLPVADDEQRDARHRDGSAIPVDIAQAPIDAGDEEATAVFIRDATARRQAERHRQRVLEAQIARAQAFELNDNVVQGLTSAIWLLEIESPFAALAALRETLGAARSMMTNLLGEAGQPSQTGDLQRAAPSPRLSPTTPAIPAADADGHPGPDGEPLRVVIADDSADIRFLLTTRLQREAGVTVVEAVQDGVAAVEAVAAHRPDAVLLDLSMPRMDGLEAAAQIRAGHPDLRIIVLTGHASASLEQQALAAGATAYLEKGGDFQVLVDAVHGREGTHQSQRRTLAR